MDEFDVDAVLQQALDRLALLAEVTTALGSTLDADEGLRRVCRIMVPQLADWCAVDLLESEDAPRRVCVTHKDPHLLPPGLLEGCLPTLTDDTPGPLARVLRGAGPLLISEPDATARRIHRLPGWDLTPALEASSMVLAPLLGRDGE
ncbi:hypothetical protein ACWEN3_26240 [Streptomyces sp. NPDC004561]